MNVPNGGGRERLFDDWLDTHVLIKYYLPILYLGNEALSLRTDMIDYERLRRYFKGDFNMMHVSYEVTFIRIY